MKATKEQQERDLRISRPANRPAKKSRFDFNFWEVVSEYAATLWVVLYILSALIAGATLLDLVKTPEQVNQLVASLLIAYAAVSFLQFVNRGVKQQLAERKANKGE